MDKRILVVDDTKNIRMMIAKSLCSVGYEVHEADNGYGAIELSKKNRYDVVILDIRMPKFSGTEVLKTLKDMDEKVPVVIITAFPTVKNAVECIKVGAVDYLRKPFTKDKIKDVVESIINRKSITHLDTDTYDTAIEYAKKSINERDFDRAVKYLKKAISIDIEGGEPFNLLGNISEMRGDYEAALKYYKIAAELHPENAGIAENLKRMESRYQ